ncbi:GNAT family N-acetyltransferase [Flavobacterium sp. DG1-102-2]|uniref:GNAT family N-acetyltransferase n=1 Tax=Flavobacterium sp. DG1-102-2 TaxID=3081663 RepID=UPI002949D03D|nr:GNAT family N-acetyltransferase [Flavobacterium sp. DG1-102-2]MDV6167368.1 GNAT family N-acetyltransferase [Flavobacterium sp. DG1-102-2]
MIEIKPELDEKRHGSFSLYEDNIKMGMMVISITDEVFTVYHTEVDEAAAGKGFAKLLLEEIVKYTREHNLKLKPLCPYVHAQFKKHPELYSDIWLKTQGEE